MDLDVQEILRALFTQMFTVDIVNNIKRMIRGGSEKKMLFLEKNPNAQGYHQLKDSLNE